MPYQLDAARIDWGSDNVPVSSDYGDVYYSRDHGLEETRYVFLSHNHLEARWRGLTDPVFRIAETGFGTGLNFLACWQLWKSCMQAESQARTLQFISVEKHPLSREDLTRALANWPELESEAQALIDQYPPLLRGHHRLRFASGVHTVILDLIFEDAETGLRSALSTTHQTLHRLAPGVDAWFLDGFAPGSNPGMWNDRLFDLVAAHSRPGTTFATFTAAGFVKRALKARGFRIDKVAGYGRKRDMLRGEMLDEQSERALADKPDTAAWHIIGHSQARPRHVAVIGGGLAGAHTARALADRGIRVTVFEGEADIAAAASGNPQGILFTKLSHRDGQLNRFALSSFHHALRTYRAMKPLPGEFCGVFQLLGVEHWAQLQIAFSQQSDWCQFLTREQARERVGAEVGSDGVWYPQSGWLKPAEVCRQRLNHPLITIKTSHLVSEVKREASEWQLNAANQTFHADAVVVATGQAAAHFAFAKFLPLRSIRGQLSYLPADAISPPLKAVVCDEGYVAPVVDGKTILGASYEVDSKDLSLRDSEHADNLQRLQGTLPDAFKTIAPEQIIGGRAALRCASPDYLPLVGPLPAQEETLERFALLAKNAKTLIHATPANLPGLYVNVAHGSRGLTSTPLCAELLASQICGEILPLPHDLVRALSPSRFLIRDLIRGKLALPH
ncbi:tRNA 5-methylaminomethyl-2-thiouridine biosynthesis bifunctional protein [Litorivivens lipolytica]|uniref:tRNA 5-methylaminomethyl-2-thiouridine biosynthesis bifunctional protein MnmC n=1 Tax=Litorivivens lipolytica TaxID=1524264 RepID=A0A7W4W3D2_9GAMM|nr:tRNA 5-methylaminomethyl-2-thiouridine biosynthesis bifunctional protein [Litorivivens lipolytica]